MRLRYWYSSWVGLDGKVVDSGFDMPFEEVCCVGCVGSEEDMTGSSAEGAILCAECCLYDELSNVLQIKWFAYAWKLRDCVIGFRGHP